MSEQDQLEHLVKELRQAQEDYTTARLYRDTARQSNVRLYYTNRMEQLDHRIAALAERIGQVDESNGG